jgi:hypothetical protein
MAGALCCGPRSPPCPPSHLRRQSHRQRLTTIGCAWNQICLRPRRCARPRSDMESHMSSLLGLGSLPYRLAAVSGECSKRIRKCRHQASERGTKTRVCCSSPCARQDMPQGRWERRQLLASRATSGNARAFQRERWGKGTLRLQRRQPPLHKTSAASRCVHSKAPTQPTANNRAI